MTELSLLEVGGLCPASVQGPCSSVSSAVSGNFELPYCALLCDGNLSHHAQWLRVDTRFKAKFHFIVVAVRSIQSKDLKCSV